MTAQPIKINLSPTGTGSVQVGEHDISKDVAAITLFARAGDVTELNVEMRARPVTFEGHATVVLSEATCAMLVGLGWTPPATEPEDLP